MFGVLLKIKKNRQAQALLEYIIVLICIMAALAVFRTYIERAFAGRWKTVGDTFGHGRLYDARDEKGGKSSGVTEECAYYFGGHKYRDDQSDWQGWYDVQCYKDNNCDCFSIDITDSSCEGCIYNCSQTEIGYKCGAAEE